MKNNKLKIGDFLNNILDRKQTINVSGGAGTTKELLPGDPTPIDPPPSSGSGDPIGPPPPPPPPLINLV